MNSTLSTVFEATRRAEQMIVRASGNLEVVKIDSKVFNDFIFNVDREPEMTLADALKGAYSHHRVTCEESGSHGKPGTEHEWIIGPLDGTTNFLHDHPQYAISMALLHRGVLREVLVYAPEYNDLYMASCGQGALLSDRHIRISNRVELNRCLIGTSFPAVNQSMMDKYLAILRDFLFEAVGSHREGSTALDLCSVAVDRLDGFFEFNLKPWDVAAGTSVVKEVGGIVTGMQGDNTWLQTGNTVAGNPKMLVQMLQIISVHN